MSEVELNEEELFNSAVSDEPEAVVTEEPVVQEEPVIEEPAEPGAELTAEKPPIPPKPEWRLKEDAERARAAETELANERAEKAALRQRLEVLERPAPKVEQAKESKPDPLLDPDGYEAYLERKFEERQVARDRENSMAAARDANTEAFDEAYKASVEAMRNGDVTIRARMHGARDPGKELLKWHNEHKARAEVGTDLPAYKAKLREEALKDPEFRKAAMAAWAEAQPQNDGRPVIDMGRKPLMAPSLNGASRSGAALRSADGDVSDHELFEQTVG